MHAFIAYDAIHSSPELPETIARMGKAEILKKLESYTLSNNGKEKMEFKTLRSYSEESIRRIIAAIERNKNYVDVSSLTGDQMPEGVDILTYSFPCQDLSNVGAFHGYNKGIDKNSGSRSSLLWQVGRILQEMRDGGKALPRYLLMENVPTLLAERHKDNFKKWIEDLKGLGYISYYFQLNASNFGLPQNRPRLLMISVFIKDYDEKTIEKIKSFFDKKSSKDIVDEYASSRYYHKIDIKDLLRIDYNNAKYREEAKECTPNDTVSRKEEHKLYGQFIVDVLETYGVDVVSTIIFTGDRRLGVPQGKDIYDYLKDCFREDLMVIFLFSKAFYDSNICISEAGAAWATNQNCMNVVIDISFSDIEKPSNNALSSIKFQQIRTPDQTITVTEFFKTIIEEGLHFEYDESKLQKALNYVLKTDKYSDQKIDFPATFLPKRKFLPVPRCPKCHNIMLLTEENGRLKYVCSNVSCDECYEAVIN